MNTTFITHPSVRIKGSENNYNPVQCFDTNCRDPTPHMHCPFCVKTDAYSDPVILKAHYRVKHVDKGIDFAGLKVLRCCDRCDIVGVIKGEKKFKGAHWHCYKCKNGFNRRDEAIKHYKTHFRNPQTTFQIQIAQEVNQSVTQGFENDEATSSIQHEEFSVQSIHPVLTEAVTCMASADDQSFTPTSSLPVVQRTFDGGVSMPGVGAIETVGVSDTQTIMIIQDDSHDLPETCVTQDVTASEHYTHTSVMEDSPKIDSDQTIHNLLQTVQRLEMDKNMKAKEVDKLTKQVQEKEEEITRLKDREQELLEQLKVPQDKKLQEFCLQLEQQHKDLIQEQLSQLKRTFYQSQSLQPKILIVNNHLNSALDQPIGLDACTINTDSSGSISLDFNQPNQSADHQEADDTVDNPSEESIVNDMEGDNNECELDVKCADKEDSSQFEILQEEFTKSLDEERLRIEDDNIPIENDGQEPPTKRQKEK